jgi:cytoskeletal protein CcmA (bactofilin family)
MSAKDPTNPFQPGSPASATFSAGRTIIGETMRIQGTLSSDEEIVMNGEMEGEMDLAHRLTIGTNGKVNANVKVKDVIIAGSLKGNVDASERVTLRAGANLVGDVKTAGIVIEDGAYFKGGIDIIRPAKT